MTVENQQTARQGWVRESSFGVWFLSTDTWINRVLKTAVDDLEMLMIDKLDSYPVILDVGCGHGHSLLMLDQRCRHISEQGLAVAGRAIELSMPVTVTHVASLYRVLQRICA